MKLLVLLTSNPAMAVTVSMTTISGKVPKMTREFNPWIFKWVISASPKLSNYQKKNKKNSLKEIETIICKPLLPEHDLLHDLHTFLTKVLQHEFSCTVWAAWERVHPAASTQHCIIWKEKYMLFTVKKATLTYLPWNYHSTFLPLSLAWAGTWKNKCLQLECSCVLQTLNVIPEEPDRQWQAFFLGFQLLR